MTVKTFGVSAFNSYLINAGKQTKSGLFEHVVMGNESADLDAIVSSSMYAYFLHHRSSDSKVNIVPLVNIRESDISLRPEVKFLFSATGVEMKNLTFRDYMHLDEFNSEGRLKLTLIDHNDLAPSQSHLKNAVVEIIDHHFDENQFPDIGHRVIEPVGSCATLVAEQILDTAPELLDKRLARFLCGPILLDTVNLDPSKGRCREKDISIASRLLELGQFSQTELFKQLMEKRSDLSSLGPDDLLIKDFKIWTAGEFRFGISVIPVKVKRLLSVRPHPDRLPQGEGDRNPDVLTGIREFAAARKLDLYLIMAYHEEAKFTREIICYSAQPRVLSRVYSSFLQPMLDLNPLTNIQLHSEIRENFIIGIQGNSDISRKNIGPEIKTVFLDGKKHSVNEKETDVMEAKTGKTVEKPAILISKPMNKGIHWEWRAFGTLSEENRRHVEQVCSTPLESSAVTDKYLWSAGCKANIKIRRKTLKFKRLLRAAPDGFELWEEGRHLKYKFPLDVSAIDLLEDDLCVKAPDIIRSGCNNIDDLMAGLSLFQPAIKCIKIIKHRSRCLFSLDDVPIQLEIAQILSPVELTSIAIESNSFESNTFEQVNEDRGLNYMRGARDLLQLPDSFKIMGYLQFLDDLVTQGFF